MKGFFSNYYFTGTRTALLWAYFSSVAADAFARRHLKILLREGAASAVISVCFFTRQCDQTNFGVNFFSFLFPFCDGLRGGGML
jgi:hypothetical protein